VAALVFTAFLLMATSASVSVMAATSQSLPAYCGTVGVQGYQQPLDLQPPYVALSRGTIITVTTAADDLDGNVTSTSALVKNPGPDGTISLREAITATNNNPGVYTIVFSPQLKNPTITIQLYPTLPALTGGNVIINGDTDGDGVPDVTIQGGGWSNAFTVESSGNTLYGLKLKGNFTFGVLLTSTSPAAATYANNIVDDLFIQGPMSDGVGLQSYRNFTAPNAIGHTAERWINTAIINNIIDISSNFTGVGIRVGIAFSSGAYIYGTTIMDNTVTTSVGSAATGGTNSIVVNAGIGVGSNGNKIFSTLIAYNTVNGGGYANGGSILVFAGGSGASNNSVEGLRVIGNSVNLSPPGQGNEGIGIGLGEDTPPGGPYPVNNTFEDAWVIGNIIRGPGAYGIDAARASQVSSVEKNIFILGNTIDLTQTTAGFGRSGIRLISGSIPDSGVKNNLLTDSVVMWNTILLSQPELGLNSEGILVIGGQFGSTTNQVNNSIISNNLIQPGGDIGINVFGGFGGASGNTVSSLQIICNLITSNPTSTFGLNQPPKGITVIGGYDASGNTVKDLLVNGNLVAGILDDLMVAANVGQSSSGNMVAFVSSSLTTTTTTTTISTVTSTFTTTALSTTTSTITSTLTTKQPPITNSSTATVTTTSSVSSGGGIPEFPYQLLTIAAFTVLLVASYLMNRRRNSNPVAGTH